MGGGCVAKAQSTQRRERGKKTCCLVKHARCGGDVVQQVLPLPNFALTSSFVGFHYLSRAKRLRK